MLRRLSALTLIAALLAAQVGCRSRCDRPGLFSSNSNAKAPCQTVGKTAGCFDGITGQPCPCPPGLPATAGPGVGPGTYAGPYPGPYATPGPPGELPMPGPSDLIQPPPAAIPLPAPPGGGGAVLPPPVSP